MNGISRNRLRRPALIALSLLAIALSVGLSNSYRILSPPVNAEIASRESQQGKAVYEARAQAFADFDNWAKDYLAREKPKSLNASGVDLAKRRRSFLKALISSDPAKALSLTVSNDTRRELPSAVTQYLEVQISAYGDYLVTVSDEIDPISGSFVRSHTERLVVIHGKNYRAAVY